MLCNAPLNRKAVWPVFGLACDIKDNLLDQEKL